MRLSGLEAVCRTRFRDPRCHPHRGDQAIHAAGGDPVHVGLQDHRVQRLVDAPAWLQPRREERPGQEMPLLGCRFEELRAVYRARNSRRVTVRRGCAPMWLAKLGSGMGPVFAGRMPDLIPSGSVSAGS